ncbi:MAG: histidinol-phosphate transaminase [Desulfobacterota bacterium]|nr:histidinol-phosphate transaminase [Thermodesulfobacteriota bacterium]
MIFSTRLRNLKPYVAGEQPQDRKYLKLNTNENPYPPSPRVKAFLETLDPDRLRLYPDPAASRLREKIAERYGLSRDQVFVSNGSDEALSFCFYAFFDSRYGKLLFPDVSYSFYPVYCDFYGIEYEKIPLGENLEISVEDFVKREKSCGLVLANPNAPTGTYLPLQSIRDLLENTAPENAVLLDEAYIDFGGESAVSLLRHHKNLLIVRTFSKSMSLAGVRLGFVMAGKDLIEALVTVKDSFNSYPVNSLTQGIGEIALSDESYYRSINDRIVATRESFSTDLGKLGWTVLPSRANFVFARKEGVPGKEIYRHLKERGILVRHFDTERIRDFVRITIGTKEDMERLLHEIRSNL